VRTAFARDATLVMESRFDHDGQFDVADHVANRIICGRDDASRNGAACVLGDLHLGVRVGRVAGTDDAAGRRFD
jgi:hypothetical protein